MTVSIHRRQFLLGTSALLAAPAVLRSGPARAETRIRLGHGSAVTNNRHLAVVELSETVARETSGRVVIEIGPNSTFGNDAEMMKSLASGELDMSANGQGPASTLVPELAIFGLPFLFRDAAAALAVADGPLGQQVRSRFEKAGLVCLGFFDNGIRYMTNSQRPIREPKDVAGLRFRTPNDPMTKDIFQTLGASTKTIAFGEMHAALKAGSVDGQENPASNIADARIYEVNTFISLTAHKWECSPILMTQAARQRLGQDFDVVAAAAQTAILGQREAMQRVQGQALDTCRAAPGVQIVDVDSTAFVAATQPVSRLWKNLGHGKFVAEIEVAARG